MPSSTSWQEHKNFNINIFYVADLDLKVIHVGWIDTALNFKPVSNIQVSIYELLPSSGSGDIAF